MKAPERITMPEIQPVLPPTMVIAEKLRVGRCEKQNKTKQKIICRPQIAEMHVKGMTSIIPDSYIYPCIEEC